jgi:hypothetical protein
VDFLTLRRRAFWAGVPIAFAAILFWPTGSTLRVGGVPFALELNGVDPRLPWPIADVWSHYPATLLAVAVLVLVAVRRRPGRQPRFLPTFFLPTYVGGIESAGLLSWSLRCHSLVDPPEPAAVLVAGVLLSNAVLLATVAVGALAARTGGHRRLFPIPPVVGAILASNALPWWLACQLV